MNNYRSSFLSHIPPVVKNLIAINVILWLAAVLTPVLLRRLGVDNGLSDLLGMHYWASDKFNLVQLVTYAFMHGSIGHIFFNMFALYMFGSVLENYWGARRFLIYYLVTGIGAGIVQQIFWTVEFGPMISAMNEAIANGSGEVLVPFLPVLDNFFQLNNLAYFNAAQLIELKTTFMSLPLTVGASGSVFGLLLAFGWLFPEARLMMLFIPVPIKARIFVLIYGVAELFLGVANFSGDSVAHFAHLGGMLFGVLMILIWKKKRL